ncbi:MAG: hypothetical protein M3416_01445 [Acidobacteriota bacterium]|nr:hypothetical protein [Acidobacteriota bacterium]
MSAGNLNHHQGIAKPRGCGGGLRMFRRIMQAVAGCACVLGAAATFIGYAAEVTRLYKWGQTPMAVNTALLFFILGVSQLAGSLEKPK